MVETFRDRLNGREAVSTLKKVDSIKMDLRLARSAALVHNLPKQAGRKKGGMLSRCMRIQFYFLHRLATVEQ